MSVRTTIDASGAEVIDLSSIKGPQAWSSLPKVIPETSNGETQFILGSFPSTVAGKRSLAANLVQSVAARPPIRAPLRGDGQVKSAMFADREEGRIDAVRRLLGSPEFAALMEQANKGPWSGETIPGWLAAKLVAADPHYGRLLEICRSAGVPAVWEEVTQSSEFRLIAPQIRATELLEMGCPGDQVVMMADGGKVFYRDRYDQFEQLAALVSTGQPVSDGVAWRALSIGFSPDHAKVPGVLEAVSKLVTGRSAEFWEEKWSPRSSVSRADFLVNTVCESLLDVLQFEPGIREAYAETAASLFAESGFDEGLDFAEMPSTITRRRLAMKILRTSLATPEGATGLPQSFLALGQTLENAVVMASKIVEGDTIVRTPGVANDVIDMLTSEPRWSGDPCPASIADALRGGWIRWLAPKMKSGNHDRPELPVSDGGLSLYFWKVAAKEDRAAYGKQARSTMWDALANAGLYPEGRTEEFAMNAVVSVAAALSGSPSVFGEIDVRERKVVLDSLAGMLKSLPKEVAGKVVESPILETILGMGFISRMKGVDDELRHTVKTLPYTIHTVSGAKPPTSKRLGK